MNAAEPAVLRQNMAGRDTHRLDSLSSVMQHGSNLKESSG